MFPKGKSVLLIKTKGLPNLKGHSDEVFEFRFVLQKDGLKLMIPGTPRGYDEVIPSSSKQETWLRKIEKKFENGLREVWYCLWEVDNEKSAEKFLAMIEPNTFEKKYL